MRKTADSVLCAAALLCNLQTVLTVEFQIPQNADIG